MSTPRVTSLLVSVLAALLVAPLAAHAATPLFVVGTSDVSDSKLMSTVIKPGFEAAYPQWQLAYTGSATNTAITSCEERHQQRADRARRLAREPVSSRTAGPTSPTAGRFFYGDFILAGPNSDPAGVAANAPHDMVTAFERIAAEGSAPNSDATFVFPRRRCRDHRLRASDLGADHGHRSLQRERRQRRRRKAHHDRHRRHVR